MPHCIVEYSSCIDAKLLKAIYDGAVKSTLFAVDGSDIKVRVIPYEDYTTGNLKLDFVHVQLRILSGRNSEQKSMLSESVLSEIKLLDMSDCSVSVEVVDMDRESYSKAYF